MPAQRRYARRRAELSSWAAGRGWHLTGADPSLLATISKQDAAYAKVMNALKATPGYDDTGYIEYSAIDDTPKKQLSGAINALAEDLSKLSQQVSS